MGARAEETGQTAAPDSGEMLLGFLIPLTGAGQMGEDFGGPNIGPNFLTPEQTEQALRDLRVVVAKITSMQQANIEAEQARLDQAQRGIADFRVRVGLGQDGNGHERGFHTDDSRMSRPQGRQAKGLPAPKEALAEDGVDGKARIVLDLIRQSGQTGISRASITLRLTGNRGFNPKGRPESKVKGHVGYHLKNLHAGGLIESRGRTSLARWFITGQADQVGKSQASSKKASAGVTKDVPQAKGNRLVLLQIIGHEASKEGSVTGPQIQTLTRASRHFLGCSSAAISSQLTTLRVQSLIENVGGSTSKARWRLTDEGKRQVGSVIPEKSLARGRESHAAPSTGRRRRRDGSDEEDETSGRPRQPARLPPKLKKPPGSGKSKSKTPQSDDDWEKLVWDLLQELEEPPTFDELLDCANKFGASLGWQVANIGDTFLENKLRAALLRLKGQQKILIGSTIEIVPDQEPPVCPNQEQVPDDDLEILEIGVSDPSLDLEPEDASETESPSDKSAKKKEEDQRPILTERSSKRDWQQAVLEAVRELQAELETAVSYERILDKFREDGGTTGWCLSSKINDNTFEDAVDDSLPNMQKNGLIEEDEDGNWLPCQ